MFTGFSSGCRNGACGSRPAREEDIKCSLSIRKLADIVVLSDDILTIPEDEILDTTELYTIVDGEVINQSAALRPQ